MAQNPPRDEFPRLDRFENPEFDRGASRIKELVWMTISTVLFSHAIPFNAVRVITLRLFGADLAQGVVIKPGARVKFPWKLTVGAFSWIGEDSWIDNLAPVHIGAHCCISQGAYLCTGSHDWSSPTFDLVIKPIVLEDGAWVGAKATVAPGTIIRERAVVGLGATVSGEIPAWTIQDAGGRRRERIPRQ